MTAKTISKLRARPGNPTAYRSVQVRGDGLVPRVDAVEIFANADWLLRGAIVRAALSPKEARALAIALLRAADTVEDRLTAEVTR